MPSQFFLLLNNKFKTIVLYHCNQKYPSWSLYPFLQPPFLVYRQCYNFFENQDSTTAPIQALTYLDKNQDMPKDPIYEIPTLQSKQNLEIRGIDECGTR